MVLYVQSVESTDSNTKIGLRSALSAVGRMTVYREMIQTIPMAQTE